LIEAAIVNEPGIDCQSEKRIFVRRRCAAVGYFWVSSAASAARSESLLSGTHAKVRHERSKVCREASLNSSRLALRLQNG
jgi:hypothetical protein